MYRRTRLKIKLHITFFLCGMVVIFCLQPQKGSENTKKTRRLTNEEIKKQLIDSIINNGIIETEELNEKADKVEKPEDAAAIIK